MKPFHPHLAVVTGAGSGIGRGTAKALAARGQRSLSRTSTTRPLKILRH